MTPYEHPARTLARRWAELDHQQRSQVWNALKADGQSVIEAVEATGGHNIANTRNRARLNPEQFHHGLFAAVAQIDIQEAKHAQEAKRNDFVHEGMVDYAG